MEDGALSRRYAANHRGRPAAEPASADGNRIRAVHPLQALGRQVGRPFIYTPVACAPATFKKHHRSESSLLWVCDHINSICLKLAFCNA